MDNSTEKLRQAHLEFLRLEQTKIVFQHLRFQRIKLLETAEKLVFTGETELLKARLIEAHTVRRVLEILEDTEKFIQGIK